MGEYMNYKQCVLRKNMTWKTTWIPEKFAKKGKYLTLRNDKLEWINGWEVIKVNATILTEPQVLVQRDGHKNQRQVSDI